MKKIFLLMIVIAFLLPAVEAQVTYPYPLQHLSISTENKVVSMAYMDVKPDHPNGRVILLFHGKNFSGYYFKELIPFLVAQGYRVIAPDQVGWGRSDKPDIHYSFHGLAMFNKILLDSLHVQKVILIGHSMGGMLATRFSLLYPQLIDRMILEDPIGLEDYKTFVPYQPIEKLYANERKATYESYKKYQEGYYPEWKPEYEQYVKTQAEVLTDPNFDRIAWVNAFTYQMIYEQPIVYEFDKLSVPVLLVIGLADRTIVGKESLSEEVRRQHGQYPQLGKETKQAIKNVQLIELPGVGHIPHVQDLAAFEKSIIPFLSN